MMRFELVAVSATVLLSLQVCAITVKGGLGTPSNSGIHSVSQSKKYLISSFPNIKTVAYTHLPDTIWRPLYIGDVADPRGVVADPLHSRLYVADQGHNKIYWYQLLIEDNGLLKTDGLQHVAVDGVTAYWLSVNGVGDLYFTGQMIVQPPASSSRSVYRMDESKIAIGNALDPVEVYSRANSGYPDPHVWMPSGVAVDSFNVYWGNQESGTQYGSVCTGTRQNIGVTSALEINVLSQAVNEVRGIAMAGTSVFYITPQAIYGQDKTAFGVAQTDPAVGLIQSTPNSDGWDPKSIAFDGEGTMYWTEAKAGIIYQFPAMDTNPHPIEKYIDAPQVYGVTVYSMNGEGKKHEELKENYGMQSSATPLEDGVRAAFHVHFLVALLSAVVPFVAC